MTTTQPLILFDGQCGLCTWSVRFIMARDRGGAFRFAPLQGRTATRECERLGIALPEGDPDTLILIENDRAMMRSDAALAIASRLCLPWRLLATMRAVPRPLRDSAYRWIARNRYRWFGRVQSCPAPSAALRERMLD